MEKSMKLYFLAISILFIVVVIFWGCTQKNDNKIEKEIKETTTVQSVQVTESEEQTVSTCATYYDVPLDISLQNHILNLSAEYCINPNIIIAIIAEESAFNPQATGDNGASMGLMQIQQQWHGERMDRLSCTDLFDPYENITVGVDYLAELMNRYDGDIVKAIVAYQQGSYNGEITEYATDVLKIASSLVVKTDV